jgi:hypothetical protein
MEEKRRKSDLISAELGRRMLLGWGLYVRLQIRSLESSPFVTCNCLFGPQLTHHSSLNRPITLVWVPPARQKAALYGIRCLNQILLYQRTLLANTPYLLLFRPLS